jgi:hypothetical protein
VQRIFRLHYQDISGNTIQVIIAVCSQSHMKHNNTMYMQDAEFLMLQLIIHTHTHTYNIYIYMCVCVCVCARVRVRVCMCFNNGHLKMYT